MKAHVEDISSVKKRLVVEIDAQEVDKQLSAAYRKVGKSTRVPGFRPGKTPLNILESYFGVQVREDVARELINSSVGAAFDETKTFPIGPPIMEKDEVKRGMPFQYSAVMEVRPKIELPRYEGIEVQKEILNLTDEDIAKQLEQVRQANAKLNSVEPPRPIRNDDYVVMDYEAFDGDSPVEGFSGKNAMIKVGVHEFNPKVEEGLLGVEKGGSKEITVHFEGSHPRKELAGKDILFRVSVLDVKELILPELNDAFAESLGADLKSIDELKAKIRENLTSSEEKRIDKELKQRIMDQISGQVEVELPRILVDAELYKRVETLKQNLKRNGTDPEKVGLTDEKLNSDLQPVAERRVKNMLILGDIAADKEIKVNAEDVTEHFKGLAAVTGQDPEVLKKYYEARELMGDLEQELLEEKTLNYLVEHATISTVERSVLAGNKAD